MARDPATYPWRARASGPLSLDEARELLRERGVLVPEFVHFVIVEEDDVDLVPVGVWGKYLDLTRAPAARLLWNDLINTKRGWLPVRIRKIALSGPEWVLAVFGHELYEIRELYALFLGGEGSMTMAELTAQIDPNGRANLHMAAWDEADRLVNA